MDSFAVAGDESDQQSQPGAGLVGLVPILSCSSPGFPAVAAAEQALTRAILEESSCFTPADQRSLLGAAAREWPRLVGLAAIGQIVEAPRDAESPVARFGSKLARLAPWCSKGDWDELIAADVSERAIVVAVATIALGHLRCTLQAGLGKLSWETGSEEAASVSLPVWKETPRPYLSARPAAGEALEVAYAKLRTLFGFVPHVISLQADFPRIVAAEAELIDAVLGPEDHLSQSQKHSALLGLAVANHNTYLAALHAEILSLLGSTANEVRLLLEDPDQMGVGHAEMPLTSELRKLALQPGNRKQPLDRSTLRASGLSEMQIEEGVLAAALANFLCVVQFGLGAVPDFPPLRTFSPLDLYPSSAEIRPTQKAASFQDPDLELVARVKAGETEAFESLMRLHTRRIFKTLFGILGNHEEARDATQDTFLKAFEHVHKFEGRSKFSTWLTSIAVNTGTELLRRRRPTESLDESDDDPGFRPRQIQSWVDNPEQSLAKSQLDELVREGVLRLPQKYRVALLLRDINQLSTEDAAAALGLSVPATKARILRGRLMLRESLTPHLAKGGRGRDV